MFHNQQFNNQLPRLNPEPQLLRLCNATDTTVFSAVLFELTFGKTTLFLGLMFLKDPSEPSNCSYFSAMNTEEFYCKMICMPASFYPQKWSLFCFGAAALTKETDANQVFYLAYE